MASTPLKERVASLLRQATEGTLKMTFSALLAKVCKSKKYTEDLTKKALALIGKDWEDLSAPEREQWLETTKAYMVGLNMMIHPLHADLEIEEVYVPKDKE